MTTTMALRAGRCFLATILLLGMYQPAHSGAIRDQGEPTTRPQPKPSKLGLPDVVIPNPEMPYSSVGGEVMWPLGPEHAPHSVVKEHGLQLTALDGEVPLELEDGSWQIDSFFDVTYFIALQVDNGPIVPVSGLGTGHVVGTAPAGEPRVFQLELVSLELAGEISPTMPFLLRASPTLASTGEMTIESLGNDEFRIDGFFDVFTELSLDGGATWIPAVAVPEPSSLVLTALAGLGIGAFRWRRYARARAALP